MGNEQRYLKNKEGFLNNMYNYQQKTKDIYYGIFKHHILQHELYKGKDLRDFTKEEIEYIIMNVKTKSERSKRVIYTAVNNYLGYIRESTNDILNTKKIIDVDKNLLEQKYLSLEDCYRAAVEAEIQGVPYGEIVAFLLARYGVSGKGNKFLLNLRWDDIDEESKSIRIKDNDLGIVRYIPIDRKLIKWIREAKEEKGYVLMARNGSDRMIEYIDKGYVLKVIKADKDRVENFTLYTFFKRVILASGMLRTKINDLVTARKIDLILEIEKTRTPRVSDFIKISELISPECGDGAYSLLIKDYKKLYPDKEIIKDTNKIRTKNIKE